MMERRNEQRETPDTSREAKLILNTHRMTDDHVHAPSETKATLRLKQ